MRLEEGRYYLKLALSGFCRFDVNAKDAGTHLCQRFQSKLSLQQSTPSHCPVAESASVTFELKCLVDLDAADIQPPLGKGEGMDLLIHLLYQVGNEATHVVPLARTGIIEHDG